MNRTLLRALALSAVTLCVAGPTLAQQTFATPQDAIKFRKDTLKELGQNFKRLGDMTGGKAAFDAEVAKTSANRAAELIKLPWAGFGPGTEGGKAKPAIWKEQDKFKQAAADAEAAVAQVAVAAQSGNLDTLKAAMGKAGATCKACHDQFRE